MNKVVAFIPLSGEISVKKLADMYRMPEHLIRRSLQPLIERGLLEEKSDGTYQTTSKMQDYQREAELDALMARNPLSPTYH